MKDAQAHCKSKEVSQGALASAVVAPGISLSVSSAWQGKHGNRIGTIQANEKSGN